MIRLPLSCAQIHFTLVAFTRRIILANLLVSALTLMLIECSWRRRRWLKLTTVGARRRRVNATRWWHNNNNRKDYILQMSDVSCWLLSQEEGTVLRSRGSTLMQHLLEKLDSWSIIRWLAPWSSWLRCVYFKIAPPRFLFEVNELYSIRYCWNYPNSSFLHRRQGRKVTCPDAIR